MYKRCARETGRRYARRSTDVARENAAAISGLQTSVLVIEDSVAVVSEVATEVTPADVRPMQVMCGFRSQRSTSGGGTCQEEYFDGVEAGRVQVVRNLQRCQTLLL